MFNGKEADGRTVTVTKPWPMGARPPRQGIWTDRGGRMDLMRSQRSLC